jgi:hypothetical protein
LQKDPSGASPGGKPRTDVIVCAFFWSRQIGVDYSMNKFGFPRQPLSPNANYLKF